jgi:hypothetical protein
MNKGQGRDGHKPVMIEDKFQNNNRVFEILSIWHMKLEDTSLCLEYFKIIVTTQVRWITSLVC